MRRGLVSRLYGAVNREELKHWAAFDRCLWVVEIDLINMTNDPRAKPRQSRLRRKDIADECGGFRWAELDGGDFFGPPTSGDGGAAGGTQIARPVDLAEGADQPAPASVLADRYRRRTRQAALAATNGEEHIRTHRDASGQEGPRNTIEERNP